MQRRLPRCQWILASTLLLLPTACSGGPDDSASAGWQALTDTIGDTIRVRTISGSVWGDTAILVPEVSIGVMEGPDEFIIGDPHALAVTWDGTILILDTQLPVLRAFAPDGSYLRNIGRDGSGPGEYAGPDGTGVLLDGRIVVRDPPNARIAVFDADGEYLYQWPLSGGFNSDQRHHVDAAGNHYAICLLDRSMSPWDWKFGLIRYSSTGEILDTIPSPTWEYDYPKLTASRENSRSVTPVPFSPTTSWSFSPKGYMVGGVSTDYRIDLFPPDGPVLRIEREWVPVPVSPAEADVQRRRVIQRFQRQYGSWRWNGPDIPDTKPPFKDIFVSWEGDIWVSLTTEVIPIMSEAEAREEEAASGRTPLRFREPVAFDVFDSNGRFLGPVKVPESFRTEPEPIIRGDHVWAVTRDELDVPRVVRFRIQRG